MYIKGRGLQMLTRSEEAGVHDEFLIARLRWVDAHQRELEKAIESAISP